MARLYDCERLRKIIDAHWREYRLPKWLAVDLPYCEFHELADQVCYTSRLAGEIQATVATVWDCVDSIREIGGGLWPRGQN